MNTFLRKTDRAAGRAEIERPPLYRIEWVRNPEADESTALFLIREAFRLSPEAIAKALAEAGNGRRVVLGIYNRDIARTKIALGEKAAKLRQFPFPFLMKKEPAWK